MTDTQTPRIPEADEETRHALHAWLWPGEWQEALARWTILILIASVATTALALHPWLHVLWLLAGLALLAAARRRENTGQPEDDQEEEEEPVAVPSPDDMADIVAELGTGTGVLLTALCAQLLEEYPGTAWKTRDVRALLDLAEVRVREGVRVAGVGNGPGIHRDDVPPLPSPAPAHTPVGVVAAGQDTNTNANNVTTVEYASGAYTLSAAHKETP